GRIDHHHICDVERGVLVVCQPRATSAGLRVVRYHHTLRPEDADMQPIRGHDRAAVERKQHRSLRSIRRFLCEIAEGDETCCRTPARIRYVERLYDCRVRQPLAIEHT